MTERMGCGLGVCTRRRSDIKVLDKIMSEEGRILRDDQQHIHCEEYPLTPASPQEDNVSPKSALKSPGSRNSPKNLALEVSMEPECIEARGPACSDGEEETEGAAEQAAQQNAAEDTVKAEASNSPNEASTAASPPVFGRQMTRVAAGHCGGFLSEMEVGGACSSSYVLKKSQDGESVIYERIWGSQYDSFQDFVPDFGGCVDVTAEADPAGSPSEAYMRLSNVLQGFEQAFVMDIKLGFRSFAEEECKSKKPRPDLYEKMLGLCPDEPTKEEREAGAITKHRWMTWRDAMSSSAEEGFRIDGIAGPGTQKLRAKVFSDVRDKCEIVQEFLDFLPPARWRTLEERQRSTGESEVNLPITRGLNKQGFCVPSDRETALQKLTVARLILEQLQKLKEACESSAFVSKHEFVGTSLLIVVDRCQSKTRVAMIDFAKTAFVPEGLSIDHRAPWKLGNHEDGLLYGIENCIDCWRQAVDVLLQEPLNLNSESGTARS